MCIAALVWFEVMRGPHVPGGGRARRDRARHWELTVGVTLAVAVGGGNLAAVTSPPWAL